MILAHKLTFVFAGVAVAVGAAVDVLGLLATTHALQAQTDRSLVQAVATIDAGGIPDGLPASGRLDTPTGAAGSPSSAAGSPPSAAGSPPSAAGSPLSAPPPMLIAQYVDASGKVSSINQGQTGLPVTAQDLALARACDPRVLLYHDIVIDATPYRLLTRCPAAGKPTIQVARNVQDNASVVSTLVGWLTGLTLSVVGVAGLSGRLVSRKLTRRLTRLTVVVEKVSSTGQLKVKVPARGNDEVGRLGAAVEVMLGELARARDDQRRLVQNAGHELRTPLTSIRTNVSLLARLHELDPQERFELLSDLGSETAELTSLIDEVIELATDRRSQETPRLLDFAPVAEQVVTRARRRGTREIRLQCTAAMIFGRPAALERALTNLIDNAVKFDQDSAAPIEVIVVPDQIEVRDRGPGIPVEDLERIFDRFHRAATARSVPGSGLGLAIVANVAQAHQGQAFATNRPGGGAVVGFTLRLTAATFGATTDIPNRL